MSNDPNQTQGPWNDPTEEFVPPLQPPPRQPPAQQQPPQWGQQQPPQQFQVGQPPQQFGPPMGQQPPQQFQVGQQAQQFGPPPMGQQFQQQPYQATQQTYQQAPQQFGPPPVGQRPPQRSDGRTSRLLWIAISAVVVIVLIIAILAGVSLLRRSPAKTSATPTVATTVAPTKTQAAAAGATEARAVAGNYYSAIEQQDYTKAYSYLDTSVVTVQGQPATQQGFTLLAQTLDQTKGKVSSFTITGSKVTGGTATVTVKVTRNGQSYDVHLTLKQEGSDWKITSFDNI